MLYYICIVCIFLQYVQMLMPQRVFFTCTVTAHCNCHIQWNEMCCQNWNAQRDIEKCHCGDYKNSVVCQVQVRSHRETLWTLIHERIDSGSLWLWIKPTPHGLSWHPATPHYQNAGSTMCACLFSWQSRLNTLCADRTMCPLYHFPPIRFSKSQLTSSICHYIFRCKAQYLVNLVSHSLTHSLRQYM